MGFALFTQSGTFNPSSYGLSVGDVVHVKAVGGGGGGTGMAYNDRIYAGIAGNASSFGSILTAAGGLGAGTDSVPTTSQYSQQGAHCGGPAGTYSRFGTQYYSGGAGGDGWAPGVQEYIAGMSAIFLVPLVISSITTSGIAAEVPIPHASLIYRGRELAFYYAFCWKSSANSTATTTPYSRAGGNAGGAIVTCGGVGYGAGGGGAALASNVYYCGGNGGVIADAEHVIDSATTLSVTVGNGGNGGGNSVNNYAYGGGGARGCVAIWW